MASSLGSQTSSNIRQSQPLSRSIKIIICSIRDLVRRKEKYKVYTSPSTPPPSYTLQLSTLPTKPLLTPIIQDLRNTLQSNRLRQEEIHPRLNSLRFITGTTQPRQRNDIRRRKPVLRAFFFQKPDCAGSFEAVHGWHGYI